jgi:hypothetical protein
VAYWDNFGDCQSDVVAALAYSAHIPWYTVKAACFALSTGDTAVDGVRGDDVGVGVRAVFDPGVAAVLALHAAIASRPVVITAAHETRRALTANALTAGTAPPRIPEKIVWC